MSKEDRRSLLLLSAKAANRAAYIAGTAKYEREKGYFLEGAGVAALIGLAPMLLSLGFTWAVSPAVKRRKRQDD